MIQLLLVCLTGFFAAAFAVAIRLLLTARAAANAAELSKVGLESENSNLRALLVAKDESLADRLADKERSCAGRLEEQRNTFNAAIESLKSEFSALAAEKLGEKASVLSEKNAKDVKPLFDALKEKIAELKASAESSREANVKLGAELKSTLGEVGEKAQSLGRQAENFISALKGGNKNQGNWGEGIVRNALEKAGLKPGFDFVEQEGASGAGLPDFTVSVGLHRKVVIDAKVNIDAFLDAVRAADEGRPADAESLMKVHAENVRSQIKGLASKDYPARLKEKDGTAEYSPIVIMAMPSEATYAAALSSDPKIGAFANENNIVLASPQMLFGYLVLFKMVLDRLKLDRDSKEISKRASQIVMRIDQAFQALEKIGKSLDDAQRQYHVSMKKLGGETGGWNILVPAKELARLANLDKECKSAAMNPHDEE